MKVLPGLTLACCYGVVAHAAPARLIDCNGLPCVLVTIGQAQPIELAIDTGNANTFLDNSVAQKLGLTPEPVTGHDGKPLAGLARARAQNVVVADVPLGDLTVLVGDLKSDQAKGTFPKVDGTIAYTAFKDRVLTLDFGKRTVTVSDRPRASQPSPGGILTRPTFGAHGPPVLVSTGFAVNGRPVTVQVDTMFSGSLLIYPTSVEKLSLSAQSKSTRTRFFPFTDGGVNMLESTADTESFNGRSLANKAPLYFATPDVHLPDGLFDGTVGVALMKDRVVTFDLRNDRFSII